MQIIQRLRLIADEGKVLKVDSNGKWAVGTDNIEA